MWPFLCVWNDPTRSRESMNERKNTKQAGKQESSVLNCDILTTLYNTLFTVFFIAYFQGGALKSVHFEDFLNNFCLNYPIAIKFSDFIWKFLVIMFTKNKMFCIQITPATRCLFKEAWPKSKFNLIYMQ